MKLGKKIKYYRELMKYSQETLAFEIDVSRQTISSWENDKTYPGLEDIILISEVLDVSMEELILEDVKSMKEILNEKSNKIKRNKEREILNRLVFLRFVSVFIGSLILFPVHIYYESIYLLIPALLIINGVIISIPIEILRKKYNLKTYKEIANFFDEKYE